MSPILFVLQQFVMTLEGVVHGFCYSRMLTKRREQMPSWILILCVWSVYIATVSLSWFSGQRVSGYLNLLVSFSLLQIVLRVLYQENRKTRITAWMLLYMMQAVADIGVSFVWIVLMGHGTANYLEDNMILILCTVLVVGCVLELAACWMYRKHKKVRSGGFMTAAAGLMVMILYMVFLACGLFLMQGQFSQAFLTASWISIGGTALILTACFFQQEKQHRQNELEQESLTSLQDQQEQYFRGLEQEERKASFLRHDHLNVLAAVSQLLQQEQSEEAGELLDHYLNRIESVSLQQAVSADQGSQNRQA